MDPPSMVLMAKVVSAGIKTMVIPEMMPGTERGRVIRKKVWTELAPRSLAALMTLSSILDKEV